MNKICRVMAVHLFVFLSGASTSFAEATGLSFDIDWTKVIEAIKSTPENMDRASHEFGCGIALTDFKAKLKTIISQAKIAKSSEAAVKNNFHVYIRACLPIFFENRGRLRLAAVDNPSYPQRLLISATFLGRAVITRSLVPTFAT